MVAQHGDAHAIPREYRIYKYASLDGPPLYLP